MIRKINCLSLLALALDTVAWQPAGRPPAPAVLEDTVLVAVVWAALHARGTRWAARLASVILVGGTLFEEVLVLGNERASKVAHGVLPVGLGCSASGESKSSDDEGELHCGYGCGSR